MQEQFEAPASERPFDDVYQKSLTTSSNDVSLADQRTAMAEMRSGNTTASTYLPELSIDGLDSNSGAKSSVQAGSREGAVSNARDYWEKFKEDSAAEGGV